MLRSLSGAAAAVRGVSYSGRLTGVPHTPLHRCSTQFSRQNAVRAPLGYRSFASSTNGSKPNRLGRFTRYALLTGAVGTAYVVAHTYWNPRQVAGPWQVHFATALPLKAASRFFGWFNERELPVWLRTPGLTLYATLFGCNLEEMADPDLTHYRNLAEFFYRELRDDVRPLDETSELVSPSDGRVLHFGAVVGRQVEQVKGVTYNLDAFLGTRMANLPSAIEQILSETHADTVTSDREFADINGIHYTLDTLLSGGTRVSEDDGTEMAQDAPETSTPAPAQQQQQQQPKEPLVTHVQPDKRLYYCVIYLAPGDYHRFHSPANWVVHGRRHFAGELYSVSPYMASILKDLFVLNERVALFGRWRHGFFSMTPVGATNVGSIRINFDQQLETNRVEKRLQHGTFTEASYAAFSPVLGGRPTKMGEEVGGFRLGSTVVLVFEAPTNFEFTLEHNQCIKLGERLGRLRDIAPAAIAEAVEEDGEE